MIQVFTKEQFDTHYITVPNIIYNRLQPFLNKNTNTILDFGCNYGIKTLGVAKLFPTSRIIGIDINDKFIHLPTINYTDQKLPVNLNFIQITPGEKLSNFMKVDFVYSWSVFEHVDIKIIKAVCEDIYNALNPNGIFFLQINPLYYSPYGSHLESVFSEPWYHLQNKGDMENKITSLQISEERKKSHLSLYNSLNHITYSELKQIIQETGFTIEKKFIGKTSLKPPSSLLTVYPEEDLMIEGIQLILKKESN